MTVAVVARDYDQATAAAIGLGLGNDWVYPSSERMIQGVQLESIVYVDGWMASAAITADTMQALVLSQAPAQLWPPRIPQHAYPSPHEPVEPISAPFVDMGGDVRTSYPTPAPRTRRGLPPVWRYALFLVGAMAVSAAVSRLGTVWGWW